MDEVSVTIWKDLQYFLSQGLQQVSLETHSLADKNISVRNLKAPWE